MCGNVDEFKKMDARAIATILSNTTTRILLKPHPAGEMQQVVQVCPSGNKGMSDFYERLQRQYAECGGNPALFDKGSSA
jgi:hypothetical protein